jgi:hypothetical protein
MPRKRDLVGEDVVVTDKTVMGYVYPNHKEVARADARCFAFAVGPVKGAELADQVIVTNLQITLFALKFYVLWLAANHGVLKDPVSRAKAGKTLDDGVSPDFAIWADFHVIFNYGCGVNSHF